VGGGEGGFLFVKKYKKTFKDQNAIHANMTLYLVETQTPSRLEREVPPPVVCPGAVLLTAGPLLYEERVEDCLAWVHIALLLFSRPSPSPSWR